MPGTPPRVHDSSARMVRPAAHMCKLTRSVQAPPHTPVCIETQLCKAAPHSTYTIQPFCRAGILTKIRRQ